MKPHSSIHRLLVIILFALAGCNFNLSSTTAVTLTPKKIIQPATATSLPTIVPSVFPSLISTATKTDTPLGLLPTETIQPPSTIATTPTFISLPINAATKKCLDVESSMPSGFLSEGTVILADYSQHTGWGELTKLTSLDPSPITIQNVPTFSEGVVSPDGASLVYGHVFDDLTRSLIVISSDDQVLSTKPWNDEWGFLSGWLDNERVLFRNRTVSPPEVTFTILDPFTFDQMTISPDMPDLFIKDPTSNFIGWNAVIDPTLTRIVYIRQHYDPWERDLVLRDLEAGRELWSLEKYSTEFIQPVWSPDGDQLAIVAMNREEDDWNRFELTISSRDGELNQWVDIQGYYPEVGRGQLSWSPNGRYLAFSIWGGGFPVLVLDVVNRQLIDYCIPGGATYSNVIWSPDSTQMIIPRQEEPFIVVDLERNLAAQIVQDTDLTPVGWLTEEKP
jgi:hypothetical protein